jgi:hypothetical protein
LGSVYKYKDGANPEDTANKDESSEDAVFPPKESKVAKQPEGSQSGATGVTVDSSNARGTR